VSDLPPPDPDQLPLDVLWRLVRREAETDDPGAPVPFLVALQQRPIREVFQRAAALTIESDATKRAFDVRVLRELGSPLMDWSPRGRWRTCSRRSAWARSVPCSGWRSTSWAMISSVTKNC
jgi:hypothetical protein